MSLLSKVRKISKVKLYGYGAVLLLLVAASIWFTIWYLVDENQDLSQENTVAVADAVASAEYVKGAKVQEKQYTKHKERVDEALKDNQDYATQPVPESVAVELRDPASSK